jgi:hypothetical protein
MDAFATLKLFQKELHRRTRAAARDIACCIAIRENITAILDRAIPVPQGRERGVAIAILPRHKPAHRSAGLLAASAPNRGVGRDLRIQALTEN